MQQQQQRLDVSSPHRPYPSSFQAGLSPTPFSPGYSQPSVGGQQQQHQQPQRGDQSASSAPELSPDELSWLQYVRRHELLPYIDSHKGASAASGPVPSASSSSSNIGSLLNRPTTPALPTSPTGAVSGQQGQTKNIGFALVLNKVTGIRIPPHVEAKESRSNLRFRIHVSFFDTLNKRFFGRTWSSPLAALGSDRTAGPLSIGQQVLYYRSSLYSEYCLAVVEYVLCVVRPQVNSGVGSAAGADEEVVVDRFGIGWTVLTLFSRDPTSMTDINDPSVDLEESVGDASLSLMDLSASTAVIAAAHANKMKRRQLSKKLWAGTPRALLFMDPINFAAPQATEWTKRLTQAVGESQSAVTLLYELFVCRALQPFFHLFREFEILGRRDILAGLPLTPVTNPLGVARKVGRTRGACLPQNARDLSKIFLPVWQCKLLTPSIRLPPRFESRMLDQLTAIKLIQWGGAERDSMNLPANAPIAPLDRAIVSRTLVVGLHNGRRYIRTPYKLPLATLSDDTADKSLSTPRGQGGDDPTTLRFEGECNVSDLMCSVVDDPSIALTFELHYELRWTKSGMPHSNPLLATIVVGWTVCLLASNRLRLDGTPQTVTMQRGPGRTINNARVYGFADESEEAYRREPDNTIALTIAIESAGFGGAGATGAMTPQIQQQYAPNRPTVDIQTPALASPSQSWDGASKQALFPNAFTSPNQGTQMQPLSPNRPTPPQQAFGQSAMQPFQPLSPQSLRTLFAGTTHMQQDLNLQSAQGLSVGIQTGPELAYDSVLEKDPSSTGLANTMGTSQGYSKLRASTRSAVGAQPTVLGRPVSLTKEMSDPLKAAEFLLAINTFSQSVDSYNAAPIQSLVFACRFFDQGYWRSSRVPLQVSRDATFDPYNPHPHQLYNQSDKLLGSNAMTVTTNPFHATFKLMVSAAMHRLFVEYLYTRELEIEVWDADRLFQIGVARLPLAQTLRQGEIQIERRMDLPVTQVGLRGSLFERDGTNLSAAAGGAADPLRGTLGVSFVHVGVEVSDREELELSHIEASTIPSVSSSKLAHWGASQNVLQSGGGGGSRRTHAASAGTFAGLPSNVSLNTTINRPSRRRVKTIADSPSTDPNFIQTLQGRQGMDGLGLDESTRTRLEPESFATPARHSTGHSRSSRQRATPLHRTEILHASLSASLGASGLAASRVGHLSAEDKSRLSDEMAQRSANLRKIRQFRERAREEHIAEMLRGSHSAMRTIYPTYGGLVFFEVAFTNPYTRRTRFRVRIDDPLTSEDARLQAECQVVSDTKEWIYLKSLYGLATPTSRTMFDDDLTVGGGGMRSFSRTGDGSTRRQDIMSPVGGRSGRFDEKEDDYSRESMRRPTYVSIVLDGSETAYIPVKFQSFNSGDAAVDSHRGGSNESLAFPTVAGTTMPSPTRPIMHRIIQVNVETVDETASTVAYLRVDVRPQAFHVDRTLRFHHWSDEILKAAVDLPRTTSARQQLQPTTRGGRNNNTADHDDDRYLEPTPGSHLAALATNPLMRARASPNAADTFQTNLHIAAVDRIQRVNCSSDDVAFDFTAPDAFSEGGGESDNQVSFKMRVGGYPSLQRFYLCLYTDIYSANLHSIVEVVIYSHLRAELAAIVGQRTTGRIFLPSTDRVRRVQMCSSSHELTFSSGHGPEAGPPSATSTPFLLQAGQVNTLDYVYHTSSSGKRSCLIHLVDLDTFDLVQSWCLFVQATYPKVNNTFNITLQCGQGARKAFDYENAYKVPRTYFFESSAPDRMKLREEMVQIPPLAVRSIHLVIAPQDVPGTDVLFVFINDEKGKNEECLQFNVHYQR